MRKILAYMTAAVLSGVLCITSCSSDDDTSVSAVMTGEVSYVLPAYTVPGQKLDMTAGGIIAPTDLTWYWVSASMNISETDTVYGTSLSVVVPDRLGEDTLAAYAKKDGYYTRSSIQYTQVFNPAGDESVKGILCGDTVYVDKRDGAIYRIKRYGSLDWFTDNLRYAGELGGSGSSYQGSDSASVLFGRLYSWQEATGGECGHGLGGGPQGACPEGWSVPTEEDWTDFANAVKPSSVRDSLIFDDDWEGLAPDVSAVLVINDKKVWEYSPDNVQTNAWRWNAIPAGKSSNAHQTFEQIDSYGFWWVSNLTDDGRRGLFRYIYWDYPDIPFSSADKDNIGFSVRCVRKINQLP